MIRPLLAFSLGSLTLGGCSAAAPRPPPDAPGIFLQDALAYPFRLGRLEVALDGRRVYAKNDNHVSTLAGPMPSGAHELSVIAHVSYRCAVDSGWGQIVMYACTELELAPQRGAVVVRTSAHPTLLAFPDRPRVDILGPHPTRGRSLEVENRAPPPLRSCPSPESPSGMECRIVRTLTLARHQRDPVFATCLSERLQSVRILRNMFDSSPTTTEHERLRRRALLERLRSEFEGALQCRNHPAGRPSCAHAHRVLRECSAYEDQPHRALDLPER